MASLNKLTLIGHVGNDPEIRNVGEIKVASLSVATTEKYKKKDGTEVNETEWHKLEIWGALSNVVENYVKKGTQLYVEGKLKTEKYTNKEGVSATSVKIRVSALILLGSGNQGESTPRVQVGPPPQSTPLPSEINNEDSDLPF